MVALQKMQQAYHAVYTMIQVAVSVSSLSFAMSAASVSSILANINPTFKSFQSSLQVHCIFTVSFKFVFFQPSFHGQHIPPSPLAKLHFFRFFFFFVDFP